MYDLILNFPYVRRRRSSRFHSVTLAHSCFVMLAAKERIVDKLLKSSIFCCSPYTHTPPCLLIRLTPYSTFPEHFLWHSSARVSEQRNICWRGKFDFERKLSLQRVSSAPQLARIRKLSKYVCAHIDTWARVGVEKACENLTQLWWRDDKLEFSSFPIDIGTAADGWGRQRSTTCASEHKNTKRES